MKRRQRVLKPRGSPDMVITLKPLLSGSWPGRRPPRPWERKLRDTNYEGSVGPGSETFD
jgi:hypothetical protein